MRLLRILLAIAALLLLPLPARAARYYVSPSGSPHAAGTYSNPWDLQTALSQPDIVVPGDIIWLLPGTYGDVSGRTLFESSLTGTDRRPIQVRQYPGGRATINGGLRIYGAYTWFWGFEITSSIRDRVGLPDGTSALLNAVDCWGPGTRLINLVIHDTRQGIGMWTEAIEAEVYGNIIFNNGFQASDRGHGHGIYVQNYNGTKLIADNFIFNQFDIGISAYSTSASWVRGLDLQGNVVFNNGAISAQANKSDNILFAAGSGVDRISLESNYTYDTPSDNIGYSRIGWEFDTLNGQVSASGNYFIGGQIAVMLNRWTNATFQNNVTYSADSINVFLDFPSNGSAAQYNWSNNTYYGAGKFYLAGRQRSFPEWCNESGLDRNSTFISGAPTGMWIFIRPNYYEPQRANVVIYNWSNSYQASLDLSSFLDPGTKYEVRDAQNFWNTPVASGTYNGDPIVIPLQAGVVAQPQGNAPTAAQPTAPRFATFVVLPK